MRPRFEFASRFRILKGGKISLIVSALVTSVSLSFASPSGGVVTSGNANISQSGTVTNINQSSQKASINWTKFNIARDETVNFNQPNVNAITLNRVIGNERSIINGALNANGQVWILNSNGVLFGKNASVNTSGLLATTASLSDEAFQAGAYHFKNATSNTIINEGTIKVNNSSYVILASNETRNTGSIEAVKAKVHLVGANEYSINLNGNSLVDLTIEKGVMDALVENSGTIINEAGEIYLTTNAVDELLKGVVNHTGIIEANSLDEITGKVELFAHGGEVQVGGTIKASEGFVETSGKDFKILDNATIEAGKWLIDPTNLTVDSALASSTQSQLKNGDVELQADEDITVSSNITWATTRKLTLTAGDEIYVNAIIENTNSINGGVYFNAANTKDKVIFGTNGKVIINNIYQLQWINQALKGTYELGSDINAGATTSWNGGLGWDPIGDNSSKFTGSFDGNSHVIDALHVTRPNEDYVGLFGDVGMGGTVTNIGLTNVNITGDEYVGALVGFNYYAKITNSYATGSVSGKEKVGGLVGNNFGTVTNSYATGSVDGDSDLGGLVGWNSSGEITNSYAKGSVAGDSDLGGLVGHNSGGTITNSYATGSVDGNDYVGGLVGFNNGTITNSYATGSVDGKIKVGGLVGYHYDRDITNSYAIGRVSGKEGGNVGGLVGYKDKGTTTKCYWDIETSGQSSSDGGTGLTTEQFADPTYFSTWDSSVWQLGGGSSIEGYGVLSRPYLKDVTIDSDKGTTIILFASGWGTEASPYTITTWAQLANIDSNSDTLTNRYYYTLSNNLTTSTTGYSTYASSSAKDGKGWDPIGYYNSSSDHESFIGTFDGNGHTIDALYINRPNEIDVGLFGDVGTDGIVMNIGLTNVDITGKDFVGGLVGWIDKRGEITNSYATGSVSGNDGVGGLVGLSWGTISNSYATGSVDGNDYVGGLVGRVDRRGEIINSYASGSVSGSSFVGGLVGYNYGIVTNSYATGSVSGEGSNVGGLVGYHYAGYENEGKITKSYWDIDTSGQSSSSGGTGLTTEQFADSSYFSTWDSDIWQLTAQEDAVEGYEIALVKPYLKDVTRFSDRENTTLFASGWGTKTSPYTITSWEQLQNINFNSETLKNQYYYSLSNNLTTSTTGYSTYASSSANGGKGWDPIGDGTDDFEGSFEGNGYIIDSVYINRDNNYVGLFGSLYDAKVTNLGVSNVDISGKNHTGGLAGYSYNSIISNTYTTGKVEGAIRVGGLVGYNTNSSEIANSYAQTNVKATQYVGGLVGCNGGNSTISNTYSTGTVTQGTIRGGLIGQNLGGTITNSYWDTDTSGQTNGVGDGDDTGVTGLTTKEMGYGQIFDTASWNIEVDNTLTSGNAPLLRYNDDGTATWIIAALEFTYTLGNETLVYSGTQDLSSIYTTSSIFGSDYSFLDSDDYTFTDSSDTSISSVKNVGTYTAIGLKSKNSFLTIASSGNTKGTITINKKEITATYSAEDKTYDGTTLANVSGSLAGGIISGDSVSLSNQSANFEDKNAGSNKQVNITNIALSGDDALNYTLTSPTTATTSANINKKEITATYTADDKTYDGTTLANVNGSLVDAISGDSISLNQSASFEDKNAGTNKQVNITNIALSGDDALNYILTSPITATTNATINKKEITATYSAEDKIYDGTTTATVSGSLGGGIISGDQVSLLNQSANFEDKNAGDDKQVNITNIALSGDDALNYVVSDTTTSATINKKGITATYSAEDKTYDGTTLANVSGSLAGGIISGDSVSLSNQSANFEDKNAGSNKQVNITNIALSGDDALNYTLTSPTTATTSANINKKEITATYTADDKTYDGTTLANVNGSLVDAISGDSISLNQSASFEDKNAGTNKQVNITNIALSGDDALNYILTSPITATTNATINKKEITATYSAEDKIYDGTTTATVSGSLGGGIISGDKVSLLNQSANFEDKNAGDDKQVNITNIALSGDDALNYVVSDTTTSATINKKGITATYSAEDKTYDGTTLANVSGSLAGGIISGDSVSLSNQSANFEDKNAGSNKQVNITNIALSGDDALNYTLTSPTTATTSATINKKEITATYRASNKYYDGTTDVILDSSSSGLIASDDVYLTQSASFADEKIGNNKQINISNILLKGTDSLNYSLLNNSAIAHASINVDLKDIIGSIRKEKEHKIKNHFIEFNPIRKEIVLEIINGGIKLPKTVMTQSLFFNDSDNKGNEI